MKKIGTILGLVCLLQAAHSYTNDDTFVPNNDVFAQMEEEIKGHCNKPSHCCDHQSCDNQCSKSCTPPALDKLCRKILGLTKPAGAVLLAGGVALFYLFIICSILKGPHNCLKRCFNLICKMIQLGAITTAVSEFACFNNFKTKMLACRC